MFLQVDDGVTPESEHPTQGRSPDLKLDTQPPMHSQAVEDARCDTALWLGATACWSGFCGLAPCFGASTTTLGSEVVLSASIVACDVPVPPGLHSNAIEAMQSTG
jgi:hypothetical protein